MAEFGADHENPIWRKNLYDISHTADFLLKFTNFCYRGDKGRSSKHLNDSI